MKKESYAPIGEKVTGTFQVFDNLGPHVVILENLQDWHRISQLMDEARRLGYQECLDECLDECQNKLASIPYRY